MARCTDPGRELPRYNANVRANVDRPIPWANQRRHLVWQTDVDSANHWHSNTSRRSAVRVTGRIDKRNRSVAGMAMEPIRSSTPATGQPTGDVTYYRPSVHARHSTD